MYESWVKRQEEYEHRKKLEKLEWHIPQVDCVQTLLVAMAGKSELAPTILQKTWPWCLLAYCVSYIKPFSDAILPHREYCKVNQTPTKIF